MLFFLVRREERRGVSVVRAKGGRDAESSGTTEHRGRGRGRVWFLRTLAVFNTPISRGKSETPLSSVATDDSRKDRDVRSAATQSPYVAVFVLARPLGVAIFLCVVGWR